MASELRNYFLKVEVGETYRFITPFDQYREHNKKLCKVLRPLTCKEADLNETGPMFKVELEGGEVIDVFDDELYLVERV